MKYFIKIDRKTVKRNSHYTPAGWVEMIPGLEHYEFNGTSLEVRRDVHLVRTSMASSKFLYDYEDMEVICDSCGWKGSYNDLESDETFSGTMIYEICPKCEHAECCELEYEELTEDELNKLAKENKNE